MEQLLIGLAVGAVILTLAIVTFCRLGKNRGNNLADEDRQMALILNSGDETLINLYQNAETAEEKAAIIDFVCQNNTSSNDEVQPPPTQETPAKTKRSLLDRMLFKEVAVDEANDEDDKENARAIDETMVSGNENETEESQPDLFQEQTPKLSRKQRREQKRLAKRQAKESGGTETLTETTPETATETAEPSQTQPLPVNAMADDTVTETTPETATETAEPSQAQPLPVNAMADDTVTETMPETATETAEPSQAQSLPVNAMADDTVTETMPETATETAEPSQAYHTYHAYAKATPIYAGMETPQQTMAPAAMHEGCTLHRQIWLKDIDAAEAADSRPAQEATSTIPIEEKTSEPEKLDATYTYQPPTAKDLGLDLPYGIIDEAMEPIDVTTNMENKHIFPAIGEKHIDGETNSPQNDQNSAQNRWERFAEEMAASQSHSGVASSDDIMDEILRKVAELEKRLTGDMRSDEDMRKRQEN